ncbi:phage GP46 family protein [Psychrobacter pygoscelis]|uniref:phage GP46 family protein n=1 Tax=Psychrobacter pygoscelis TaxID=2488563 RepID=UPI0013F3FA2E|nr:phage GP46 family protein [Psychrobacter pygoscelis]
MFKFKFDQQTSDYKLLSIDSPPTQGQYALAEAAYLRLITPKGSYFDDADFGSELYKLRRSKDLPRVRSQAIKYAKQALEPLRDAYYLNDITVAIEQAEQGYVKLKAALKTTDGSTVTTHINVQVAG